MMIEKIFCKLIAVILTSVLVTGAAAQSAAPNRSSGRNFDFCYYSGVNIQPLNKIKGVTARRSLSPTQKETNQARATHCKK